MVTFDATLPGTPVSVWRDAIAAHTIPQLSLDGVSELLVVSAHPDDETLGAGGLIAEASERGIPVHVVVVTDGAASHPDSPTHTPGRLASIRAREVFSAVGQLAPAARLTLLGYRDGLVRQNRAAIARDLAGILDGAPSGTLVLAPWRGDRHRDHREVGELLSASSHRVLEYPIWLWHWGSAEHAPWADMQQLALSPAARRAKAAAMREFPSQTTALSSAPGDEQLLGDDFLEHFTEPTELFISASLGREYFNALYERHDDPWGFTTRWYEKRKRALTMAALPRERFTRALEIGCSIGTLTELLVERCGSVLAVDVAESAVRAAQERVGLRATVKQLDVAVSFPRGTFDLVVLSEVGYYFTPSALRGVLSEITSHLRADGVLIACHWRHPVDGYLQTGDAVHEIIAKSGLIRTAQHLEKDFVLEVWERSSQSVAEREGLA